MFKNPIIDFVNQEISTKKGEINNLTSAIVSAPWTDKITLHANMQSRLWIYKPWLDEIDILLLLFLSNHTVSFDVGWRGRGWPWPQTKYKDNCRPVPQIYDICSPLPEWTSQSNDWYWAPQSTHRLATATFWRTFHHDGKISPGWWGWGVHAHPLSLYLPSRPKLQYTVRSSWEGRYTPPISSLFLCTLCWALTELVQRTA